MTEYPVFKNAPIIEALLDIQVALPPDVDLGSLALIQNRLTDRYPKRQDRMHWEIQANAIDTVDPSISRTGGQVGYAFLQGAEPPDKVFQARLDGFTFSKLKPYNTWSNFRDEARELWTIYSEFAKPTLAKRLGLRTINKLELPLPFADFKEYLLTTPDVAPGIGPGLSQFFMQVQVPQPEGEIASITSAMQPATDADAAFVTIIFDVDVFVEQNFPSDSEDIWDRFEKLRQIKNDIFFNSLTDKAKELF